MGPDLLRRRIPTQAPTGKKPKQPVSSLFSFSLLYAYTLHSNEQRVYRQSKKQVLHSKSRKCYSQLRNTRAFPAALPFSTRKGKPCQSLGSVGEVEPPRWQNRANQQRETFVPSR